MVALKIGLTRKILEQNNSILLQFQLATVFYTRLYLNFKIEYFIFKYKNRHETNTN